MDLSPKKRKLAQAVRIMQKREEEDSEENDMNLSSLTINKDTNVKKGTKFSDDNESDRSIQVGYQTNLSSEQIHLLKSLSPEELAAELVGAANNHPDIWSHLKEVYGHRVIALSPCGSSLQEYESDSSSGTTDYDSEIDETSIDLYHSDCSNRSERLNGDEIFLQDYFLFPFSAFLKKTQKPVLVERTCGVDEELNSVLIRVKDKQSGHSSTCPIHDIAIHWLPDKDARGRRRRRNARVLRLLHTQAQDSYMNQHGMQ